MKHEQLEDIVKEKLCKELGDEEGEITFGRYTQAKPKMREILKRIMASEPGLTDHDYSHVQRVLGNIYDLVEEDTLKSMNGSELFLLLVAVLIHDSGNIFGRENHQNRTSEVFDEIFGNEEEMRSEKKLVLTMITAHSGKAKDGSHDTLKEVPENECFMKKSVRLRQLAAIVRLADELDESPKRSDRFALKHGLLPPDSIVFHEYAKSTEITIQRREGRVVIQYNISVFSDEEKFMEYLDFTFQRIAKIDFERQYARFYSDILSPFKRLEVTFDFWEDNDQIRIDDYSPIVLTDNPFYHENISELVQIRKLHNYLEQLVVSLKKSKPKIFHT